MVNLIELFAAARVNPRLAMNDPERLTGKHCQARLQRAKARRKRLNRGHGKVVSRKPYDPM